MTLPNFLVIGAEKAGTTWLYKNLKMHPDIYLPETKEIHFFNKYNSNLELKNRYQNLAIEWYEYFFKDCNRECAVGEVTPMYLCDPVALERIKRSLGSIKVIVSLRDPFWRAVSHYKMAYNKGHTKKTFEQVVNNKDDRFIKRGLYGQQLEHVFKYFSEEKVFIVFFDDLIHYPEKTIKNIFHFLDVSCTLFDSYGYYLTSKINEKSGFKSQIFGNLFGKSADLMRNYKLTSICLDYLKYIGLTKYLKTLNAKKPDNLKISHKIEKECRQIFDNDIEIVEQLTNVSLQNWKSTIFKYE
jgi:hypothetical protein